MVHRIAALLLLSIGPAGAVEAHYEVYAAGLNVVAMDADIDVTPERYSVKLDYRTVGGFSLMLRSQQSTVVEGRFVAGRAVPGRFASVGTLRGDPRVTRIDYQGGQPVIRQLVPASETERELVPVERQANTIDTLSAMAELVQTIVRTGRCEGRATTFDGRRLSALEVRTAGMQVLEPTGRSSFAGPALRCEFVGRQTGGFTLGEDRARLERPQTGTAWFAAAVPGGPVLPVRVAFQTRWFGEATMYLAPK